MSGAMYVSWLAVRYVRYASMEGNPRRRIAREARHSTIANLREPERISTIVPSDSRFMLTMDASLVTNSCIRVLGLMAVFRTMLAPNAKTVIFIAPYRKAKSNMSPYR